MPGRFEVVANPGADREARGEVWLLTSTIEGTRGQETFLKAGEPPFWQTWASEFPRLAWFRQPAHVAKARLLCRWVAKRLPQDYNQRIGVCPTRFSWTAFAGGHVADNLLCGPESGNGNGANIAFAKCADDGSFTFSNVPSGTHQLVVWTNGLTRSLLT